MKQILITGGAGYLGSVLIKKLVKKNYKVFIFSKLTKLKKKNVIVIDPSSKNTQLDQFYLINHCNLYVGPLSGPWALANLLKKNIILNLKFLEIN